MKLERVQQIVFADLYPLYLKKVKRKNRTQKELDQVICWLTGYTAAGLKKQIKSGVDLKTFYAKAPKINRKAKLITGVVCGVRVEDIPEPFMKKVRWLDKLIDELAKGWPVSKVLREE